MPCFYTGSAEGDARLNAAESHKALTKATRVLCKTCKWLEKSNLMDHSPSELKKWWTSHKKVDQSSND